MGLAVVDYPAPYNCGRHLEHGQGKHRECRLRVVGCWRIHVVLADEHRVFVGLLFPDGPLSGRSCEVAKGTCRVLGATEAEGRPLAVGVKQ